LTSNVKREVLYQALAVFAFFVQACYNLVGLIFALILFDLIKPELIKTIVAQSTS